MAKKHTEAGTDEKEAMLDKSLAETFAYLLHLLSKAKTP
jgi:hypothetical protein